jgi:hypothetical protein
VTKRNEQGWASIAATWAPIVVALCALVVSVCELRDAREHEQLNSQPRLTYTYYYNEKGAGWTLANDGLGVARLRGFRMSVDSQPVTDFSELGPILGLPTPVPYHFTNPMVGERYPAGHENILYWVEPGDAATALRQRWTHLTIQACYCSLYGECWVFSSDGTLDTPDGEHRRDDSCSPFSGESKARWWKG